MLASPSETILPSKRTSLRSISFDGSWTAASLRARNLVLGGVGHAIESVYHDDARPVGASLGIVHVCKGGDDDHVARLRQMGSGTIDAHNSRAGLAQQGIRLKARAARHVPDVNL